MRQWRVGSFSMGITLIGLGVLLLLSQFFNWDAITISVIWIPVLLITLGIEVLVYFILSRKEQPIIKYDIFSILFIMFIGFITVATYTLSSTGLLSTIQYVVQAEEVEHNLPTIVEPVDETVHTIVVEPHHLNTSLEVNNTDEINLFGTFRSNTGEEVTENQIANIHQVGDTLYVKSLSPQDKYGIGHLFTEYDLTISVPGHVNVEVRSWINEVNIDLNKIKANWYIGTADRVNLSDYDQANVELSAHLNDSEQNGGQWETEENDELGMKKISKSFGNGDHKLIFKEINDLNEMSVSEKE